MKILFQKYHGAGNDFILLDQRSQPISLTQSMVARLCDRHFGIGADGLILLTSSQEGDFGMVYFNSDGGESTLCGNGGRCVAAFARTLGIFEHQTRFQAIDGMHEAIVLSEQRNHWTIRLKMNDVGEIKPLENGYFVNTGSPHVVQFVEGIDKLDVFNLGRTLRNSSALPQGGANVNFVETTASGLYVRTYERGVEDETLACGTGVTASALVYAAKEGISTSGVNVRCKGGDLKVSFKQIENRFTDIWLEGPVERVFEGGVWI